MKAVLLPSFASDENHLNMQNHIESSSLSTGTYSTNPELRKGRRTACIWLEIEDARSPKLRRLTLRATAQGVFYFFDFYTDFN